MARLLSLAIDGETFVTLTCRKNNVFISGGISTVGATAFFLYGKILFFQFIMLLSQQLSGNN